MTERKLPPVGEWVPHDGGPRPVPEGTMCNILLKSGTKTECPEADWSWQSGIVAFCVTKYPDEEETRTGRCKASLFHERPEFWGENTPGKLPVGAYTATIVNGEVQEIHWRKYQ
jgi:hypothetical protein